MTVANGITQLIAEELEWFRLRLAAESRVVRQETRDSVLEELRKMGHLEIVRPLRKRLAANDLYEHLFRGRELIDPPGVFGELLFSASDREVQRRSFAFGNASISNPKVTRELIDAVADEMKLR